MPRRPRRPLGFRKRVAAFVRKLFGGSGSSWLDDPGEAEGGIGVREPRRPLAPTLSGAAEVELPDDEQT
jgi:hypothetical protein